MGFNQRVRLPIYATAPQFPSNSSVFPLANGDLKNMFSVIRKTYVVRTDWMPEAWLESLRIAMSHDHIQFEGKKFVGKVAMEGDAYEIKWNPFLDYPTAQVDFTIQVSGYDFRNSNCISCEAAGQLDLTDDNFGSVVEGGSGGGNVLANDQVFCSPPVLSITTYNSMYLAAPPTIDDTGAFAFTLKTPLPDLTAANIATYRVTCPDGSYDEANIFIDIDGSLAGCSAPENVRDLSAPNPTTHYVTWDTNGSPADGYYWELYEADNLGLVVLSTDTPLGYPFADMTGLEPCTDYRLFVRAVCEAGVSESAFTDITFSTPCPEQGCGLYQISFDNGTPDGTDRTSITFQDCNGVLQTRFINNSQSRLECLAESAPGVPINLVGGFTSYNYEGPCQ